jgi:hypothetical protein
MLKNFIFWVFFGLNLPIFSQFQFNFNDSVVVFKNGSQIQQPWGGGLNNAQFSEIDYDFDGDMDLFVFDRSKNQIRVFKHDVLNGNHSYKVDQTASLKFPNDVRYRALTIDYNLDSKNDLFTYGIGGLKVYKNIGNSVDGLQWELASNLLYSNNWGTMMNLYVSSGDIPAIVDVENDGDLDVLTFHISGEYLQYHQNQSQELYGHSDSLVFELKNECWGGFREDVNTNLVILNDVTSPCNLGNVPNPLRIENPFQKGHAGSTVLAFDYDGSGVKDLLIGDVAYTSLNLLINGGTAPNTNSKIISQDISFPSNSTPVNVQLFPAAFLVDVDFDGKKDLIVAPNAKNVSENERSCLKYKNTGSNSNYNFIYETSAFLQEDMIEHGTGSIPVLADLTGDGLLDLIVGNFYSYKPTLSKESKISFYKNIGTASNPIFTFIDDDFMNFSQANYGLRMIPTFGDIDGDTKTDLILGLENGTLVYYKNNGTSSNPNYNVASTNLTDVNGNVINVGQYAAPQLFDLNRDNKLDLIIGEKTGKLFYYENVGTGNSPSFELSANQLGGIDVITTTPDGYPIPHFFRNNDTTLLIIGTGEGELQFYDSIDANLSGTFNQISMNFLSLKSILGGYSSGTIADLDADGKLDLMLGQDLGGLFLLEHETNSNLKVSELTSELQISIYPNPTSGKFTIQTDDFPMELQIISLEGKMLNSLSISTNVTEFDLKNLTNGIYFLKTNKSKRIYRLVKN